MPLRFYSRFSLASRGPFTAGLLMLLLFVIWFACALPVLILLIDRPVRFSLKTLLLLMTISGITLGLLISAVRHLSVN